MAQDDSTVQVLKTALRQIDAETKKIGDASEATDDQILDILGNIAWVLKATRDTWS